MDTVMSFDLVSHLKLIETKSRELRELISHVENQVSQQPIKHVDDSALTSQEKEIVSLLKQGKTSDEISTRLDISKKTIESHRYNIRNKLGMNLVQFKAYLRNNS